MICTLKQRSKVAIGMAVHNSLEDTNGPKAEKRGCVVFDEGRSIDLKVAEANLGRKNG